MNKTLEIEIKVGFFVTIGIGLLMLAILVLGGANSLFGDRIHYSTRFKNVDGLIVGAKVALSGIRVGAVDSIRLDSQGDDILVTLAIDTEYQDWIREGATADIATQGVLGDKFISIQAASIKNPVLPPGSMIPGGDATGFGKVLSSGEQLLITLNRISSTLDRVLTSFESQKRADRLFEGLASTSMELSQLSKKLNAQMDSSVADSLKNLKEILVKINRGQGSVGALINDPGLYDDVKALLGGINRNRIMRNLIRQAVQDTIETRDTASDKNDPKKK